MRFIRYARSVQFCPSRNCWAKIIMNQRLNQIRILQKKRLHERDLINIFLSGLLFNKNILCPYLFCGRGIMAARKLPKLQTRVRFPSPAPKIQSALCRFNFWHVAVEENPVKRVRKQVDFGSASAPKSSRFPHRHLCREIPFARTKIEVFFCMKRVSL